MRKLHLHIDEMISGEFVPKNLNLLLIFQVNCPGCFIHALPTFNKLYEKANEKIGFIALSTAFEDYTLNTKENTKLLVKDGKLVGETKKHLLEQGIERMPYKLPFPIGMDAFMGPHQKEELIENICFLNPDYSTWSGPDQNLLKKKVLIYLDHQEKTSLTFTANQFKGTPTIVLFNKQNELLHSWFGHQAIDEIIQTVEKYI